MYHVKLIKGLSYTNGIISATQAKPDVFTDDKATADNAVDSGYFKLVAADDGNNDDGENKEKELEEMTAAELKEYAAAKGIELKGCNTNAKMVAKIREVEAADDGNNDDGDAETDGEVDYEED